jgi:hypothetical protein
VSAHTDLSKHVNETFGKWTVLGQSESRRSGGRGKMARMLAVRCECGFRTTRPAADILSGRAAACPGCADRELTAKRTVRHRPTRRVVLKGDPEVCVCRWHNGVQIEWCAKHRRAS